MSGHSQNRGVLRTLIDNSFLLIAGAVIALVWANVAHQRDSTSYQDFIHFDIRTLWGGGDSPGHGADPTSSDHAKSDHAPSDHALSDRDSKHADMHEGGQQDHPEQGHPEQGDSEHVAAGGAHGDAAHGDDAHGDHGHHNWYNLSFIINDVLMALFFAIAAKEVWESMLPGGALSNPRRAATPLMATLGGIVGPAAIYLAWAYLSGPDTFQQLGKGWAIPCATDIAFSYLVARIIFGTGHPAIAFLLLLAIADDAAGLLILAVFYPSAPVVPSWLLLTAGAIALAAVLKQRRVISHWAYLLGPGIISWYSFYQANIHPALGLVPIIPLLPHAQTDLGIFAPGEDERTDTLNAFEHFWKLPVEFILGLFGLVNAGVVLSSLGTGTWLVLAGLLIGKPVGITLLTLFAEKGLKLEKPSGMDYRHVVTLGMVAGIGFTVALFVSVAAFRVPGVIQDSVKMGALLSFAAAPLAIIIGKALRIRPGHVSDVPQQAAVAEVSGGEASHG